MTPSKIVYRGHSFDFDAAVNLMDDEICEDIHAAGSCITDQEFMDAYVDAHRIKYGEEFVIN